MVIVTEAELTNTNRSNAGVNPRSELGDRAIDPRQHGREETSSPSLGSSQRPFQIQSPLQAPLVDLCQGALVSIAPVKLNVISLSDRRGAIPRKMHYTPFSLIVRDRV